MNSADKELVKLTQDLIKIPSWVSKEPKVNENKLVNFIEDWAKKNTKLEVVRQKLPQGRFNLILRKGNPDLVFLAHTDTVAPSANSKYDQLKAEIHGNKIWGRGATDMKSGISSMLHAIKMSKNINNFWFFLYADEEYDFLGMKALVKKFTKIRPELMVSSDGSDLAIGHGCRGLIEIRGQVMGKSGHAAKGNGVNAIDGVYKIVSELRKYFGQFNHPQMGKTSLNLAYVLGGTNLGKKDSFTEQFLTQVGQEGNVIPDIAEFVIDIRPSSPILDSKNVIEQIVKIAKTENIKFKLIKVRHDLGAWYTDKSAVKKIEKVAKMKTGKVLYSKPSESGYIDLQMLWKVCGTPPAIMFGGGDGTTAHKDNEYIKLTDLIKSRDFFREIIKSFSGE